MSIIIIHITKTLKIEYCYDNKNNLKRTRIYFKFNIHSINWLYITLSPNISRKLNYALSVLNE